MRGGAIGVAVAVVVVAACSGDNAAPRAESTASASTDAPTTVTPTTSLPDAVPVSDTNSVVYVLQLADGVTVHYTIPAPTDHPLVERVERYRRGVNETRPVRLVLAEIDNHSAKDFEVSDIEVTEGDGDKVHFIEAWLLIGNWRKNITGQSDSPLYMEGFDLDNELLNRGLVKAGTTSTTVLGVEDFLDTVRSVTGRDRSGEMIPMTRER